jgi:uncharacterized SAM-binding protein YcdF (DUF218 family)
MDAIVLFFKSYLLPGSMSLLLLGLLVGVGLLFAGERGKRWGRVWLIALLASYWLLATPAFAASLEALLSRGYAPIESAEQAKGAQAIVVLSGGSASVDGPEGRIDSLSSASAIRLLEGVRLYRLLEDPWVVLSGGPPGDDSTATPEAVAMQRELVRLGVPPERILVEMASEDTHAQAQRIQPVLADHEADPFVLVTSGWHLPRSMGTFRRAGMTPVASAAEGRSVGGEEAGLLFLPSESALARSRLMAREVFALIYYRLRGWLG